MPYTAGSFAGGNVSATALNAELQKIEVALAEYLTRLGGAGNAMQANLDMNNNRLLNIGEAIDANDAITLGQAQTLTGSDLTALTATVVALQATLATIQTDLAALTVSAAATASLAGINDAEINLLEARSHEDRVVSVSADIAAPGLPGVVDTDTVGDDRELSRALEGDWVNVLWNITDTEDGSIFGPGSEPRLNFDITDGFGTVLYPGEYTLLDSQGAAISANYFEPGDVIRGIVYTQATDTVTGLLRLYKFGSGAGVTAGQLATSQAPQDSAISANASAIASLTTTLGVVQGDVGDLQVKQMPMSFTNDLIPDATQVMKFQASEAFIMQAAQFKAIANTAPTGTFAEWSLRKNGVQFGVVTFPAGLTDGGVSGFVTETFALDDIFSIVTGTQNGLQGVALTALVQEA